MTVSGQIQRSLAISHFVTRTLKNGGTKEINLFYFYLCLYNFHFKVFFLICALSVFIKESGEGFCCMT